MSENKSATELRFICGQCGNEFGVSYMVGAPLFWFRCKKCNVSTPVYPTMIDAVRHYKEQYGLEPKRD